MAKAVENLIIAFETLVSAEVLCSLPRPPQKIFCFSVCNGEGTVLTLSQVSSGYSRFGNSDFIGDATANRDW